MGAILGFEGTLTINDANPGFTNLRFGFGHTEVDSTTQLDEGNKSYVKGLYDSYISADMKIDDSPACATVLEAVQSREPVTCSAALGEDVTISGSMMVFCGEISTGLDEVPSMTVTCRPAPAAAAASTNSGGGSGGSGGGGG